MPSLLEQDSRSHRRFRSAALLVLAAFVAVTAGCSSTNCFRPRWSASSSRPIYVGAPEVLGGGSGKSYVVSPPSQSEPLYNSSVNGSSTKTNEGALPSPESPDELTPSKPNGQANVPSPPEEVELEPSGPPASGSRSNPNDEPALKLPGAFKEDSSLNSEVGTKPPTAYNGRTRTGRRVAAASYEPGFSRRSNWGD